MSSNKRVYMKSLFLSSLMLALMAGCGDLMGNKVVKKQLESERFRADCTLDVNAFTDVLERNISSDLRCLEDNLNLFIKIVKTEKPGFLSRTALEAFVIKNRPDIKPEMVRAMKAVFDLNHLLTGEDPEYISANMIGKLTDFGILFNEKASHYYKETFGNTTPDTPWSIHRVHRMNISNAAREIVVALRKIFNLNRNGDIHKLNLFDLLENFTTEDNREDMEKVKKVLFVKKLILGGTKEELTHVELERALLNLEPLLTIALDGIRFKYLTVDQNQLIEMLNTDVKELDGLINEGALGNRDRQVLFTIDEAVDAIRQFVEKDDFDVDKLDNLIREAKKIVMGGNTAEVKGSEMKALFNHGKTILRHGQAFHSMYLYEPFFVALEAPFPVRLNFDDYRHNYPNNQEELKTFARIVKHYRFMKGEFLSPYYTAAYKRNADAIFEIYAIEYVLDLIFKTFGAPTPGETPQHPFKYTLDQFQMHAIFKKFTKDLVELDLVNPLWPTITADNVSLLATLFQYQSDDNKVMDVNEASEFGVSLIGALKMTDSMTTYFKGKKCEFDQFNRVEPNCMRRYFLPSICDGYRKYMPLLFSSINAPKICENIDTEDEFNKKFIYFAEVAARPCMNYTDGAKEEIWYTEGDLTAMIMVVLHSETTVLRWDVNNNNILESDEVMKAYPIYSTALDGFLETRPAIIKKFKKQIYQYLVKYEEVPDEKNFKSVWKFIKFLMSFNKKSTATRKTIASVLMAIGEENKKLPNAVKVDCNLLRDPENLPRGGAPMSTPIKDNRPDYSNLLEGYLNYID